MKKAKFVSLSTYILVVTHLQPFTTTKSQVHGSNQKEDYWTFIFKAKVRNENVQQQR